VINVNVDQTEIGALSARWLISRLPKGGKVLEVRGVQGTSVDADRHAGASATLAASGVKWQVTEAVGKWDDAVARQATADAIAAHGPFDGIISQAGDAGVVQALIAAKHPFVPMSGETENGFRKLCAQHAEEGLQCSSAGTGPAQVAVALKVAIAALEGQVIPQAIKLPTSAIAYPDFKEGRDYYQDQPDGFFVGNAFPTCGISFTAEEIAGQTKADQ
jgi:ribose transport system substrate-binding protein